ncbi:MAG: anthranilate phosphoribosyltransferase 2 [Isosphaeraceae bacterium]|nr:MAG: anthranilate phosphoribosyltransferase 2 [Isosphaeraceae bacterium]
MREVLAGLMAGASLDEDQAAGAVGLVLDGVASEAEVAAFLTLVQARGVTSTLLAGAARAVRSRMRTLEVPEHLRPLLDTCGTGGDGAETLNVSTAAAVVAAACGVRVAKHGNRAATGRSGSSDVLEELGISIQTTTAGLIRCLEEVGIGYVHAPAYHPALKAVAAVRARLPYPTLFNLIGPLVNPARPELQLIGTPDRSRHELMVACLGHSGASGPKRALVVHAEDGLDEISLGAATQATWLDPGGERRRERIEPSAFGLSRVDARQLRVEGPRESASRIRAILSGEADPARGVVVANAAAALVLAGVAAGLVEAAERADRAIAEGLARRTLEEWSRVSRLGE